MINKTVKDAEAAIQDIQNGMTLMLGGLDSVAFLKTVLQP